VTPENNSPGSIAVIGAGPAGYPAAFLAADLGMQVTIIDPAPTLGGTCLRFGCIPSKTLIHAAHLVTATRRAADYGLHFQPPRISVEELRAWKNQVVNRLTSGLETLARRRNVAWLRAPARFHDPNTLAVEQAGTGPTLLNPDYILIATGSRPRLPAELDTFSPRVMDSTAALDLPDIPQRLLVVGAGYIGLEIGSLYAALGSRVTVVEMTPAILPGVDPDLVRLLQPSLQRTFQAILLATRVREFSETADEVTVALETDGKIQRAVFDRVLVSIGRLPYTDGLALENTPLRISPEGFIPVDPFGRTSLPSILAAGDVTGQPMLAHRATHQSRAAVSALTGERRPFQPRAIPSVVFTDPEIAWCGLTETQARRDGIPVKSLRFPWSASGRAAAMGRNDGLTRLLVDPGDQRILGVAVVGPGASELIAEGVMAVESQLTPRDLADLIHPHPTLSETIMEAAELFSGTATHIFKSRPRP